MACRAEHEFPPAYLVYRERLCPCLAMRQPFSSQFHSTIKNGLCVWHNRDVGELKIQPRFDPTPPLIPPASEDDEFIRERPLPNISAPRGKPASLLSVTP